jgi:hypothetical protein
MTSKPIKRHGANYPITDGPKPDWSFLKDYKPEPEPCRTVLDALAEALQDAEGETETSPEDREELKAKIRSEVLRELHQRLVVKPAPPEPPPRAGFVRDPSLDKFFELAAEEKAARRRRGH